MSGTSALALSPSRRQSAAAQFHAAPLPTRRSEEWKYSDLAKALGEGGLTQDTASWKLGPLPDGVQQFDLADANAPAWVQGRLGALTGTQISEAALAFAQGGVALHVTKAVEAPLALKFSGRGNLRVLLVLEEGAVLTLHESHAGSEQRNIAVEAMLASRAILRHVRLAPVAADAVQVESLSLRLEADARYHAHYASFGAKLARLEADIILEGEHAEAHLTGVSVLGDGAHADVTTRMHHAVGNTASTQLFKKVVGPKSNAVYQGRVIVAKGADGADSRQTAKALLLARDAEADLKPELEIFADDVKCAHGAAVGDLDADSLFYLRARGIPEAEARHLLIHAFLEDAIPDFAREMAAAAVHTALEKVSA